MDLTAAQQHVQTARDEANAKLHELAQTLMPGISVLEAKPYRFGTTSIADVAVGVWCDQPFEFEQWTNGDYRAYPVALCSHCHTYTHCAGATALRTPTDIAAAIDNGAAAAWMASVEKCRNCRWVDEAKDEASAVTGRLSAWHYKSRRGMSHTDVLALPY